MNAIDVVSQTMRACTPPNAPLSFTKITRAAFRGKNCIVANVVMFDGLPATLRLNRWAYGWSHGWDDMPGGDCFLDDDDVWMRASPAPDLFSNAYATLSSHQGNCK